MISTKDIWCPDCNQNKITKQEIEQRGKCISCYRREVTANTHNKPYVKFKDLPIERQQQIIYNRATIKMNRRTSNKSSSWNIHKEVEHKMSRSNKGKSKYDDIKELHEFIQQNSNLTAKQMVEYAVKNIKGCSKLTAATLYKIIHKNDYKYNGNQIKETKQESTYSRISKLFKTIETSDKTSRELYDFVVDELDYDKPFNTFSATLANLKIPFKRLPRSGNNISHSRRASVYTDDVMEVLNTFSTEDMTITQIYESLSSMFPNKGITYGNLSTKINRLKIPHRVPSIEEKRDIISKARDKKNNKVVQKLDEMLSKTNDTSNNISECDIKEVDRFEPIKQEINEVLSRKYKQLECEVSRTYTTDDYINFLDMLYYLSLHNEYIIRARRDQHDIMNAYQSDVVHEMENIIAEPGDTYLQDKLHLLRKERRYYEHDANDLISMKPVFELIDAQKVLSVKTKLEQIKEQRNSPVFIPIVDVNMVNKYDWASAGSLSSNKVNKQILVTNAKNNNSTNFIKINSRVNTYRVSCQLSGGGYGAFSHWHKDYKTTNEELALTCAESDLHKLSEKHKGVMWTNMDVHMLNV